MIKAVIFDLNGVIVDDEKVHQEAWRQYCKNHNFNLSDEEFKNKVSGRTEKEVFEYLYKRGILPDELETFSNERIDTAIQIFKPRLKATKGLIELLVSLEKEKIQMAIATSSRLRYFNFIAEGLKIGNFFEVVTTAHDVIHGKPNPEIYIVTAKKLNIKPKHCLVFEDTISGISAAKTAGMTVVGITTTYTKEDLSSADGIINDFTEISPQHMQELSNRVSL